MDTGRLRAFFKKKKHLLQKELGNIQSEQKPAKNNDSVANRTLPFERTLI